MMDISIPLIGSDESSDSDGSENSNRDTADEPYTGDSGSSKFLLFPVATSIFDSKSHTFLATILAVATAGVVTQFGAHPAALIVSATAIYTLGLSAFEFGELPVFTDTMDEYPFLIAMSGISIPLTIGMGYLLLEPMLSILTPVIGGAALLGTWFMNRRLYVTLKEDMVLHGYITSHSWLFATRVPFIALLTASLVMDVPAILWVGLLGYCTAVSFGYGVVRLMEFSQGSTQRHTETTTTTTSTTRTPEETSSTGSSSRDTSGDTTESDSSEEDEDLLEDLPDEEMVLGEEPEESDEPDALMENYEEAKELTMELKDAVESLNDGLRENGLSKYELPEVTGDTIPPEIGKAKAIHEGSKELNEYLLDYEEDNEQLRRDVLEVQQYIQEIDEFIYTDIDAPDYR